VDELTIDSAAGKGTRVEMKIHLQPDESFRETTPVSEVTAQPDTLTAPPSARV
jgi:hypothetical protein